MVWNIDWENEFIVEGANNTRLTPNFRLREFRNASGRLFIHWELVSVMQILRSRYAGSITVVQVLEDGLSVIVNSVNTERLHEEAKVLEGLQLFLTSELNDKGILLTINPPESLPPITLENALETAFSVTSSFETSGDRFQQVTGNFDGAGLSFGPAQWNFGTNTLDPLLKKFIVADADAFRGCFTDYDDYLEIRDIIGSTTNQQVRWGNSISTGRNNASVVQPWKGYFQALGRTEAFKAVMVTEALRVYGAKALKEVNYLQSLVDDVSISHLRCICAIYDLVIQQGSLSKAKRNIEEQVALTKPSNERELVEIALVERGKKARREYRSDCISRRLGILYGRPVAVEGRERANTHFYLLRNVQVSDPESARQGDIGLILTSVGQKIASGEAVFA